MGMVYSAMFEGVAVTAVQDLFEILAPSDAVVKLHALFISQETEEGDAQAEMLKYSIRRVTGAPTSGSVGSTPTPRGVTSGAAAAGSTVEANNTTQLTGGTNVVLLPDTFNVQAGLQLILPPALQFEFAPSTRCLIELEEAPADEITLSGAVMFEEIGG